LATEWGKKKVLMGETKPGSTLQNVWGKNALQRKVRERAAVKVNHWGKRKETERVTLAQPLPEKCAGELNWD